MADDLRDWLRRVEEQEDLKRLDGADWNLEIGCTTTLNWKKRGPVLLFDKITGYPEGYRVLTGSLLTAIRIAITLGLTPVGTDNELIEVLRSKVPQWEANLDRFAPRW
jgi:3-polyprenyl-4-hydroxybenzoate decarboxylase